MEIGGYSERGVINSLFYEIKHSQSNLKFLNELLSHISFPYRSINFEISDARILIEQSFSDFGDADVVVLVENKNRKQAMFIEAKVSAFKNWHISREFEKFTEAIEKIREITERNGDAQEIKRKLTSNLFMQLYSKTRMMKTLQKGDVTQLHGGVQFPKVSSKEYRKIGNNEVVLKAVGQLKLYCKDTFFVALVPEDISRLRQFYQHTLSDYSPKGFQEWDVRSWGYISWAEVEDFCERYSLKETLKVFEFNKGEV
ncbi:hypothetical protein C5S32_09860 [ANME-1 cluster archaeon GoMg1]|nr:hypothetical protein [ANME-1 cluster archaeon GoMg1]